MRIVIKPLTLIWMKNVYKEKHNTNQNKLSLSGFKGSIRWWYEAFIRGIGVYACDPSSNASCRLQSEELESFTPENIKKQICPACYLFGCNGWASRLGLNNPVQIKSDTKKALQKLEKGTTFVIEISQRTFFPIEQQEIYALSTIFDFITCFGAIGGKTVLMPSEAPKKKNLDNYPKRSHVDYGICSINLENITEDGMSHGEHKDPLYFSENFVDKENEESHPDLSNFWYIDDFVLNRIELKKIKSKDSSNWLSGEAKKSSKKIFSFHMEEAVSCSKGRTWGYVKAGESNRNWLQEILNESKSSLSYENLKWGEDYLIDKGWIK